MLASDRLASARRDGPSRRTDSPTRIVTLPRTDSPTRTVTLPRTDSPTRTVTLPRTDSPTRSILETNVSRPIFALVLTAFAFAACNDIPKHRGSAVKSTDAQRVQKESPIEVAVAPIINASGANVPMNDLRSSFTKELVVRRYSPLSIEYVDRKVVDASYTPGSAQESATLRITVERWDTSLWSTHGAITARMTASLIDARSGSEVLWSATADQRYDFMQQNAQLTTESSRIRMACDEIAADLLARLPARTARPGRATQG